MTIEMLREYKVFGYAVFDLVISLLGIYLLAPLLSKFFLMFRIEIPRRNWLYLTLPLSILIHMAVGNFTPMTKNFLDLQGNYVLKIIVIGLLTLGLRGIKVLK
jgi:hypothetical protein